MIRYCRAVAVDAESSPGSGVISVALPYAKWGALAANLPIGMNMRSMAPIMRTHTSAMIKPLFLYGSGE